jgi:hypothetical protein
MNALPQQYPQWMSKMVTIDAARREREAEIERQKREAEAARERQQGAWLVEVVAFLFDVALPAPEGDGITLDGFNFWLSAVPSGDGPIYERDEAGKPVRWAFELGISALDPAVEYPCRTRFDSDFETHRPGLHLQKLEQVAEYLVTYAPKPLPAPAPAEDAHLDAEYEARFEAELSE